MLGASAGIAAWIAVVGGARIWARLTAIDVPAAQAVSALPRELLIAEGLRTLLVPLLLGGGIAVAIYLSRGTPAPTDEVTEERSEDAAGRAYTAAIADAKTATEDLERSIKAIDRAHRLAEDLATETTESAIQKELKPFEDAVHSCKARLTATRISVAHAAESASKAAKEATAAGLPEGNLSAAQAKLKKVAERVTTTRKRLVQVVTILDPGDGTPVDLLAVRAVRKTIRSAAKRLRDARSDAEQARHDLREARSPRATDRIKSLRHWLIELTPVALAQRWVQGTYDRHGPTAATTLIVLPVVVVSGIALILIHPLWMVVGPLTIVAAVLLAFLARRRPDRALIVAALLAPLIAIVGFLTAVTGIWAFGALLLTIAIAWLALGAMGHWPGAGNNARIIFAAVALWSGALAFVGELGARVTKLDTVVVFQKQPTPPTTGFYLGRTSRAVFVASTGTCHKTGCRRVIGIPDKQVTCAVFGPLAAVNRNGEFTDADGDAAQPDELVTTDIAEFTGATGDACTGTPPTSAQPTNAESRTSIVSSNRLNLLGGLRVVLGGSGAPPPAPAPDVRVIGPFRIALGGSSPQPKTRGGELVVGSVLFRFDKHGLTRGARSNIRTLGREIEEAGSPHVWVSGHADDKGNFDDNVVLARQRAHAVKHLLRARLGRQVAISVHPYGEVMPEACNTRSDRTDDAKSRAYNRRAEIRTRRRLTYDEVDCP